MHDLLNAHLPLLQESYPSTPPIWFVDSDDPSLAEVLERLEDVRKGSTLVSWLMRVKLQRGLLWIKMLNYCCESENLVQLFIRSYPFLIDVLSGWFHPQLLQQLKRLICDLCRLYNLPQHPDVEMLDQPLPAGPITQEQKVLPWKSVTFNCVAF